MSIDRSDDEAPTELDLALSQSTTAEIKLSSLNEPLPADSEPSTLEPKMTVLRSSVQGARPRAPTLPTIITPSEPFQVASSAKLAAAARSKALTPVSEEDTATAQRPPVKDDATAADLAPPVEPVKDEETETEVRPPVDLAAMPVPAAAPTSPMPAAIEPPDVPTDVSDPRMLSSSDLLTDPELPAIKVPVLAGAADGDDPDGPGGTAKIVMTPPPSPAVVPPAIAAPAIGTPLPEPAPSAPSVSFVQLAQSDPPPKRPLDPKARARRAMIIAVAVSLSALGAVILFGSVIPSSPRDKAADAGASTAITEPAAAPPSAEPPAASAPSAVELDPPTPVPPPAQPPVMTPTPLATADPPAATAERPRTPSPPPRWPSRPPPRPPAKPNSPPATSQKGFAPLHI